MKSKPYGLISKAAMLTVADLQSWLVWEPETRFLRLYITINYHIIVSSAMSLKEGSDELYANHLAHVSQEKPGILTSRRVLICFIHDDS